MDAPHLVAVMGETASGKTDLAEALADSLHAQLLNADAFQVYRGMDIGTAKSSRKAEYLLMDIRSPDQAFGVGEWALFAAENLTELHRQGRNVVLVGGSGLYIRALLEKYQDMSPEPDAEFRAKLRRRLQEEGLAPLALELESKAPQIASATDMRNPHRVLRALERVCSNSARLSINFPYFKQTKLAIRWPVEVIDSRIHHRTWQMSQNGWVEEVAALREAGYRPDMPGFRAHGYRELWRHLSGEMTLEEAIAATTAQVRSYAKRQRTWLRTEPNLTTLQTSDGMDLVKEALSRLDSF